MAARRGTGGPARRRHRGAVYGLVTPGELAAAPAAPLAPFRDCLPSEPGSMPAPPWHQSHYPGQQHLLRHAAAEGQLVFVRCTRCRRAAVYLAGDLIKILNPERPALLTPFPCSKCGKADAIRVECRVPLPGEVGTLVVRRPGPVRVTQSWRNCRLGDG